MLTSLKAFATVAVVCAGCIGIPATLWKTSDLITSQATVVSQPQIKTITKTLDSRTTQAISRNGKCDVEALSKEKETFLLSQNQGGNFYVEISCINTSENSGLGAISTYSWTGLFPVEMLAKGENLSIGEKIDIKTKDSSTEENTKTTFTGKGIKTEGITGTWINQSPYTLAFPENLEIKNKLYLFFD